MNGSPLGPGGTSVVVVVAMLFLLPRKVAILSLNIIAALHQNV